MRFPPSTCLIMLGATLGAAVAQADDDLFAQAYRPYLKSSAAEPTPASAPAPNPAPALPSSVNDPAAVAGYHLGPAPVSAVAAAVASQASVTARRSRLTWLKGGRGPAVGVEPATLPATTPPPAPSVAAALSAPAAVPDYVPPASKGLVSRIFRSNAPEVPPGLPRGAAAVAMVPPGPIGSALTAPLRADESRLQRGQTDPAASRTSYPATPRLTAPTPTASRPAAAVSPRAVESSMLVPARPRTIEPTPAPAPSLGVPFAIARPPGSAGLDLDDLQPATPRDQP